MTKRTAQQINDDLDSLLGRVGTPPDTGSLSADVSALRKQVGTPGSGSLSAEVTALKSTVAKLQSPAWFKANRAATGALDTKTVTAIALSATATLALSITLFKVDEKGITILGATRDMPWKKMTDAIQKKIESKDQKDKRALDEKLKTIPQKVADLEADLGRTKTTLQGEITTKVGEAKTALESQITPLKTRVGEIETALTNVRRNVTAARAEMDRVAAGHRGIDSGSERPLNKAVAEDVRNLRIAVDKLTGALGSFA